MTPNFSDALLGAYFFADTSTLRIEWVARHFEYGAAVLAVQRVHFADIPPRNRYFVEKALHFFHISDETYDARVYTGSSLYFKCRAYGEAPRFFCRNGISHFYHLLLRHFLIFLTQNDALIEAIIYNDQRLSGILASSLSRRWQARLARYSFYDSARVHAQLPTRRLIAIASAAGMMRAAQATGTEMPHLMGLTSRILLCAFCDSRR